MSPARPPEARRSTRGSGHDRRAHQGPAQPRPGSATRARAALLDLLDPVVAAAGYDLEDVSVAAVGRRSLVRVTVDADGGIDLDAVAEVSRAVSDALDTAQADPGSDLARGALAGAYVLEVSSPGVDRPLSAARHWRRAVGRLVEVDVDGVRRRARVVSADEHGVRLAPDGVHPTRAAAAAGDGDREPVAYTRLGPGRVQVEFSRADGDPAGDPGGGADSGPADCPAGDPASDPASEEEG